MEEIGILGESHIHMGKKEEGTSNGFVEMKLFSMDYQ